jgi:hypothetical protein
LRRYITGSLPHTHTMSPDFPRHIHFVTSNPGRARTGCSLCASCLACGLVICSKLEFGDVAKIN